ncbi:MAG: cyclic nucleotide-binding domain-containing protein [Verrucomicrobiota bacterium]
MDREFEVEAGNTIIEQGEQGQGFYILKSGAVEIYKDGLLLNVLMFPGTIFGEMGDILGKPRTATVRAKTNCRLVHCADSDVESLISERPQIAVKIIKTLAARLERTTQKLADQFKEPPVWSVEPGPGKKL